MLPVQEKRIRCLVSLVHNGSGVFGAWTQFVEGHVGLAPHFFRQGGHNMPCPPHIFQVRFCIWRGFKNKSDVCHVLCEELFMLDGRPHITKLMLNQILGLYH